MFVFNDARQSVFEVLRLWLSEMQQVCDIMIQYIWKGDVGIYFRKCVSAIMNVKQKRKNDALA